MPTPNNEEFKVRQRIAHRSKYRIYGRNKNGAITSLGYERPISINFYSSRLGMASISSGGVFTPSHVIDNNKIKRDIRNRIARLSRRGNRGK